MRKLVLEAAWQRFGTKAYTERKLLLDANCAVLHEEQRTFSPANAAMLTKHTKTTWGKSVKWEHVVSVFNEKLCMVSYNTDACM
jgi:hypothetical protein